MICAYALVKFSSPVVFNPPTLHDFQLSCCGGRRRRFRRRLARCVAVSAGWTWSAGWQDNGSIQSQSHPNCWKIIGFSTIIPRLQLYKGTKCGTESAFNVWEHWAREGPVEYHSPKTRSPEHAEKKKYVHRLAKWRSNTSLKSSCFCAPDITALQFG